MKVIPYELGEKVTCSKQLSNKLFKVFNEKFSLTKEEKKELNKIFKTFGTWDSGYILDVYYVYLMIKDKKESLTAQEKEYIKLHILLQNDFITKRTKSIDKLNELQKEQYKYLFCTEDEPSEKQGYRLFGSNPKYKEIQKNLDELMEKTGKVVVEDVDTTYQYYLEKEKNSDYVKINIPKLSIELPKELKKAKENLLEKIVLVLGKRISAEALGIEIKYFNEILGEESNYLNYFQEASVEILLYEYLFIELQSDDTVKLLVLTYFNSMKRTYNYWHHTTSKVMHKELKYFTEELKKSFTAEIDWEYLNVYFLKRVTGWWD